MLTSELKDKLVETLKICEIHKKRIDYSFSKVKKSFPLTTEIYSNLTQDDLSYFDQLIFRFSKLQDSIGNRLYPVFLECIGEDIDDLPIIDILSKLEKFGIIEDKSIWFKLRETRNLVTHEYPFYTDDVISGLNILSQQVFVIFEILEKIKKSVSKRFNLFV